MSDPMLIVLFLLIVFAPCVVAYFGGGLADTPNQSGVNPEDWKTPNRRGLEPLPMHTGLAEVPLSEDFKIRSFPKGLSQRRIVVRDTLSGVKLTIAQVRAAAVELIKLGGAAAVHELALVAAAMVSAGQSLAVAAREAIETARNSYAWFAWSNSMTQDSFRNEIWPETPPPLELNLEPLDRRKWHESFQAA